MILCFTWGNPDPINILILIVYAIMALLMYKTFKEGQQQTKISLAINQFNIFQKELDSFIEEAKQIEFLQPFGGIPYTAVVNPSEYGNGINYIHLFIRVPAMYYKWDKNLDEKKQKIDNFRHFILFPLSRYYHKLYSFFVRIKNDKVLGLDYQNMLYNYIKRDLLQNYFRICNNKTSGNIDYDLSIFDTDLYKSKSFYLINNFYIENNAFQHEDLDFYTHTQ